MTSGFRFLWNATRGHRFRPWRSEYLRWRLETFTGKHADQVGLADFWALARSERRQILSYVRWLTEMRGYTHSEPPEQ
jgi:hypothetical protein